jgi:nitroreductase
VKPDDPVGLLEGLATTRAIRRYTDEPIPDDDLASILWHAGRAPSGSNRQPFRFLVLRDGGCRCRQAAPRRGVPGRLERQT